MNLLPRDLTQTPITNDLGESIEHLYEPEDITAINAALAINRPLLVFGEPGIGKSQLAKAVAKQLKRVYLSFVCDAQTESRDLLWQFDAVERLADAQVQSALPKEKHKDLSVENYIVPEALWWGLNWTSAAQTHKGAQCTPDYDTETCAPENGCVVLIDEIDKAATDVPNGLLGALGSGRFHPQGGKPVERDPKTPPLVIVTANDERNLPDAFVRRCLVLHLDFPLDKAQQVDFLVKRGRVNFSAFADVMLKDQQGETLSLLERAARMLVDDRKVAQDKSLFPLPGQAEYFDLLRAIRALSKAGQGDPATLLDQLRPYTFKKVRECQ